MSLSQKKQVYLSLEKKVEVIRTAEKGNQNIRSLAEQFNCRKTQIAEILMSNYSSNPSSHKQVLRSKQLEYVELNKQLYAWYNLAVSKNVYPCGPQLCEKAKK